ncbi:S8 family serine peptidase [[Eubacterium] cellulosolvens]
MRKIFFTFLLLIILTLSFSQGLTSISVNPYSSKEQTEFASGNRIEPSQQLTIDNNDNKLRDILENNALGSGSIYVHYAHPPTTTDANTLDALGAEVEYICKYINVIQIAHPTLNTLKTIAGLSNVVSIELEPEIKPLLNVSAPAVKARESIEYSPDTAWELGYSGTGISIAVLDTGVDDGHQSLQDKFIAGVDFAGASGRVTPKDGSYNPDDETGHGTGVAGVAMGTGGNDEIFMGIAPEAKLIDVRISLGRGGNILQALEWCIDNQDTDWNGNGPDEYDGIDIVSLSMGGEEDSDGTEAPCQLLNHMVDNGIVVVIAVGNNGPDNQGIGDIAAADKPITVGNLDIQETIDRADDEIHPQSSRGPRRDDGDDDPYDELKPDVVAPGTGIIAPEYSVVGQNGNNYATNTGTSYSCPHVSGICALMLEANPNLRPNDIKTILHETAEAIGEPDEPELSDKYNYAYGYGSVDAYLAVKEAKDYQVVNHPPVIKTITADPKYVEPNGQATITTLASDPDGDALTYEYTVTGGVIEGEGSEVTWTAPAKVGKYEITAVVSDGEFTSDPGTVTVTVEEEPGNDPPEFNEITVDPTVVEPGGSSSITVEASDPDGDEIFYKYNITAGKIVGAGPKVVWVAPETPGDYKIEIIISDDEYSISMGVTITVYSEANQPPEIESFTSDTTRVEVGGIVNLVVIATDPEQGPLDYFYFASAGEIIGAGMSVKWQAPNTPGLYTLEATVADDFGLSDTQELLLEVYQPNVAPEIVDKKVYPKTVKNDGTVEVLLTVEVDDKNGLGDINRVVIDLTSIFGPEYQKMYDNGKYGDLARDDGVYSVSYLVPKGVADGRKDLPVVVEDYSTETVTDKLTLDITAVSTDEGDKGFFEETLGVPGFESGFFILAFMITILIFTSTRPRIRKNNRKTKQ